MFNKLKNNYGTDFPAAKKTFSDLVDGTTIMEAANVNTAYDEIEAIQTFLGALGAGNTQSYACSVLDVIQGLRIGTELTYVGAAELSVAAGRIVFESGGKYRLRENTSATSVDWGDIDTGAEADTTYYVYAVADAEATTFTCMISTNAATPTGATYYKRLGTFTNDTDIVEESVIDDEKQPNKSFGSWVSKSDNTVYQALTDGFVVGYASGGADVAMTAYTDGSNPPTTVRIRHDEDQSDATGRVGLTLPVKKGDYWKVVVDTGSITALFWMPLS